MRDASGLQVFKSHYMSAANMHRNDEYYIDVRSAPLSSLIIAGSYRKLQKHSEMQKGIKLWDLQSPLLNNKYF